MRVIAQACSFPFAVHHGRIWLGGAHPEIGLTTILSADPLAIWLSYLRDPVLTLAVASAQCSLDFFLHIRVQLKRRATVFLRSFGLMVWHGCLGRTGRVRHHFEMRSLLLGIPLLSCRRRTQCIQLCFNRQTWRHG